MSETEKLQYKPCCPTCKAKKTVRFQKSFRLVDSGREEFWQRLYCWICEITFACRIKYREISDNEITISDELPTIS